jgi:hypothetical protein
VNRRNFILGVGTAATLSGAASITGASLSNTVSTDFSNFKIVAEAELTVRRNETLTDQNVLTNNENFTNSSIDFTTIGQDSPVDYSDFPLLYVDNETDGNLTMELGTSADDDAIYNNNLSTGGTEPYDGDQPYGYAPLEIENTGATDKDIAVSYTYNDDDVVNSSELSKGQVAEVYEFEIGGTRISPAPASPDSHGNKVTIPSQETKPVDLKIELDENTASDVKAVSNFNSNEYSFSDAARARAKLLDAATFGVT